MKTQEDDIVLELRDEEDDFAPNSDNTLEDIDIDMETNIKDIDMDESDEDVIDMDESDESDEDVIDMDESDEDVIDMDESDESDEDVIDMDESDEDVIDMDESDEDVIDMDESDEDVIDMDESDESEGIIIKINDNDSEEEVTKETSATLEDISAEHCAESFNDTSINSSDDSDLEDSLQDNDIQLVMDTLEDIETLPVGIETPGEDEIDNSIEYSEPSTSLDNPQVSIEINDPESVIIAPEDLDVSQIPSELHETLDSLPETVEEALQDKQLSYNLANLLADDRYSDSIELVASSVREELPTYYLMVKHVPIATASFQRASDGVKAIFTDRNLFMQSLHTALTACESQETNFRLKDFGIKAISAPIITKKAAVASNVVKATKALQDVYEAKEKQMFNDFREAFSTAAVMYCKNLQEKSSLGHKKSLSTKAILNEALKSVGIQNSEVLIEEAFVKGILRDYATIFEEALSLFKKTPDARKEVRDFVNQAAYKADSALVSNTAQKTEATFEHSVEANTSSVSEDSVVSTLIEAIRKGTL
jgi:hypothetical protein